MSKLRLEWGVYDRGIRGFEHPMRGLGVKWNGLLAWGRRFLPGAISFLATTRHLIPHGPPFIAARAGFRPAGYDFIPTWPAFLSAAAPFLHGGSDFIPVPPDFTHADAHFIPAWVLLMLGRRWFWLA
jgi:hypothetical protein